MWKWMMEPDPVPVDTPDWDTPDAKWQRACGVLFRQSLIYRDMQLQPDPHSVMQWPPLVPGGTSTESPKIEIHSVRATRRNGPDGQDQRQLIVEITQRRRGFFDEDAQTAAENSTALPAREDFIFRGGATLVFDLNKRKLIYAIRKSITNTARLAEQRQFLIERPQFRLVSNYRDDRRSKNMSREPFAFAHRGG
jgi:hypothetical protein